MARGEPSFNLTQGLPIIGKDGQLVGVVTQGDLLRALEADPEGKSSVLDAGSGNVVVAYPDESASDALFRMLQNDIGRLPVVSRENPKEMIGYLNRSSILGAWTRQMEEEGIREHGWVKKWRASSRAIKSESPSGRRS
jgi:chloride channel protein, CIC family